MAEKINAPESSSVGRLFDAAAALTGVRSIASFEGQGPMEFEALCENTDAYIELELERNERLWLSNWHRLVPAMLDTTQSVGERASLFHNSLAHAILRQAKTIREMHDVNIVTFSGGVFQNRVLSERAMALLSDDGFKVHHPELIPVNDAGISFGQVMEHGFNQ